MQNLKKEVVSTFKQSPVLSILSLLFSVYVFSLIAVVVVITVAPQSNIVNTIENLF